MTKCDKCGGDVAKEIDICPSCGLAPGPQAMSDLPKMSLREAHRKLKEEIREEREADREARTCPDCGSKIPLGQDMCPKCGLAPGPQAMTDLPLGLPKKEQED